MTTSLPPTFVSSRSMQRQDIVGFAQCWTSAFIKDLVVHPWRVGAESRRHCWGAYFGNFGRRGAKHINLKVTVDNPAGAVRLYEKLGMREVALDGS